MQGVLTVNKNPLCKVGGRLDVTFADGISEVAETKTTYHIFSYSLSLGSRKEVKSLCLQLFSNWTPVNRPGSEARASFFYLGFSTKTKAV